MKDVIQIFNLGSAGQKHPVASVILAIILPLPYYLVLGKMEHSNLYMAVKLISYLFMGYFWACLMLSVTDWIERVSQRVGNLLRMMIMTVAIILFVTDMFLIYKFDSIFDATKISIVLGADPETIREFLVDYIISPVSVLMTIIIALLCGIGYRYREKISFAMPKKFYNLPTYLFILSAIVCFSLGFKNFRGWEALIDNPIYTTSSINELVIDTYRAYISFGNEKQIFMTMDNHPEAIIENKSDIPYVVFVLGESADRNKMHGYGYSLENTPYLDALLYRGEAVAFSDTIAPANYTTAAMQYIFTFYSKEDKGKWYEYYNAVDIFSKCGYYTTWISNQSPQNIRAHNMDDLLAKRSHVSRFTNYSSNPARPLDEEMIPLLDGCLSESSGEKQFYVIHLEGSHDIFRLRYPATFAKFKAVDEQESNPKWAAVKAEYDNTFLYTDYLMEEIIKRFADKDCLLVYLSDHGNEVYDGRDFCGHSGENLRNRHMVEIPFVVWGSEKFWAKRPELKQRVFAAKDRPFMTDDFIHFLLDITGIKTTSYDPTKSVINDNFNEKRVRMYGGQPYEKQKDTK